VLTMTDASWTDQAACREPGIDPELFFPVSESGPAVHEIALAKAICAHCPVSAPCRSWALRAGEPAGIWGGTTPAERELLRRVPLGDFGLREAPRSA
jgi:WhiB family transcriptional regulator, redox-sensing transcriptional regulator